MSDEQTAIDAIEAVDATRIAKAPQEGAAPLDQTDTAMDDSIEASTAPSLDTQAKPLVPVAAPIRLQKPRVQVTVPTVDKEGRPLSKSAIKRARKTAEYEALKPYRKERDKLKKKARADAYREGLARGIAAEDLLKPKNTKTKSQRTKTPLGQRESGLRVIVDCSFDALMADKEIKSMTSQLTRCYADNKAAVKTIHLIMTGMCTQTLMQQRQDEVRNPPLVLSRIAERYEKVFKNQHHNWKHFECFPQDYLSAVSRQDQHGQTVRQEEVVAGLNREDLIYLSADAEEDLETLEQGKTYIIGGIVDKNRHKLLCQKKATKQGIVTRRLPIGQYIKMSDRKVLTVNHVFEILLEYAVSGDWADAFKKIIPTRKQAISEEEQEDKDDDEDEEED